MDCRQVYNGLGPPFFSQARSMCTGCTRGLPTRGVSPASPAAVLLPVASSLVNPRGGVGVQLGRGKASPSHGDYVGGVKVAARASQGAGHGERRLELHRRAGMARGCSISQFCGARGRHNIATAMLGRSRGPSRPSVVLATTAPFRARRRRR
jgi:hypothetical protein